MPYVAPNPIPYRALAGTNAAPSGKPRRRYPLPPSCPIQHAAYAFDQDFQMLLSSFPPAAKNTISSASSGATFGLADANAILTSLSQPSDTGAGQGIFTGSFARVPASWDDFQTQLVNYPGWLNTIASGKWRDLKPTNVTVRLRRDYFVVDPDAVVSGGSVTDSGGSAITCYTSKGKIPIVRRTPWLSTYGGTAVVNAEAKSLVVAAGVGGYLKTLPTTEQYIAWCAIATTFMAGSVVWDATHPPLWDGASTSDVTSGQFVLENSRLEDYEGNIVCRVTAYALCE